ncbi:hypothetical protein EMIT053CA3_10005 [Pseudomonas donghuensis]
MKKEKPRLNAGALSVVMRCKLDTLL